MKLILLLLLCVNQSFAGQPINEVISNYRSALGMSVPTAASMAEQNCRATLAQMSQQLLARRYPNTRRLALLTNYFQTLYQNGLTCTDLEEVNQALSELERVNALALSTEGVNPDAASFTAPKLEEIRRHQADLQAKKDAMNVLAAGQKHRSPSPSLEASYPELILGPLLQKAFLPLAETVIEIGVRLEGYRDAYDYPQIKTPFTDELASQEMTPEALSLRQQIEEGNIMYKLGTRGKSNTGGDSQFWSTENPNNPGYGDKYAMPPDNFKNFDFIERATIKPGADFITRRVADYTDPKTTQVFKGDGYEIVVRESATTIEGHHSCQ